VRAAIHALSEGRARLIRQAARWGLGGVRTRWGLGIALLATVPVLSTDDAFLQYVDLFLIYGLVVMGLNLQQGYTGIVNLGPSASVGVGAYATAVISHHLHWPMPLPFVGPRAA